MRLQNSIRSCPGQFGTAQQGLSIALVDIVRKDWATGVRLGRQTRLHVAQIDLDIVIDVVRLILVRMCSRAKSSFTPRGEQHIKGNNRRAMRCYARHIALLELLLIRLGGRGSRESRRTRVLHGKQAPADQAGTTHPASGNGHRRKPQESFPFPGRRRSARRGRYKSGISVLLNFRPWPARSRTFSTLTGTDPTLIWIARPGG